MSDGRLVEVGLVRWREVRGVEVEAFELRRRSTKERQSVLLESRVERLTGPARERWSGRVRSARHRSLRRRGRRSEGGERPKGVLALVVELKESTEPSTILVGRDVQVERQAGEKLA